MKFYQSGKVFAAEMGVPVEKIATVHGQCKDKSTWPVQDQDPASSTAASRAASLDGIEEVTRKIALLVCVCG